MCNNLVKIGQVFFPNSVRFAPFRTEPIKVIINVHLYIHLTSNVSIFEKIGQVFPHSVRSGQVRNGPMQY